MTAVVLYNGKYHPSIPITYALHMKETYENMRNLLNKINCNNHCWNLCGDLKVVAMLLGMQLGYNEVMVPYLRKR
jgi:hypothetical protein